MSHRLNLEEILDRLEHSDLLASSERQSLQETAEKAEQSAAPWYIRVLVGFGAWVATGLFLAFLGVAGVLDSEGAAIVLGLVLLIAATIVHRLKGNVFLRQFTLVGALVGQSLFIGGVAGAADSANVGAIVCIVMQGVLIFAYPDKFIRFLAALGIFGSLAILAVDLDFTLVNELLLACAVFGGIFLLFPNAKRESSSYGAILAPLGYGLVVAALLGFAIVPFMHEAASAFDTKVTFMGWPTTICVVLSILWLLHKIFKQYNTATLSEPYVVSIIVLALLFAATFSSPGILASMAFFVTAFCRKSRVLFGLTCVSMVGFITWYYYDLDATLLAKSGILFGTGVILLALRIYLSRRLKQIEGEVS